jgi:2-C-methyl-D-erythritol 4-phosphate cytidylyltransferase/2-C-methyl-D-erythritol 2,4-cyclodiphosphate synthase
MTVPSVSAVIVAAGRGDRLGAGRPKALVQLAGRSLLQRSAERLCSTNAIDELVLVVPPGHAEDPTVLAARDAVIAAGTHCLVVEGGTERQESVLRGVSRSRAGDQRLVMIHDAARPLVSREDVQRTLDRAAETGAALLARPATDTLKQAHDDLRVERTLDRRNIWLAQTPQVFRRHQLISALESAASSGITLTDSASALERRGVAVTLVKANDPNPKITTTWDLEQAEARLGNNSRHDPMAMRIGLGSDLHRLEVGRPFVLGGITLDHPAGPVGHSDGDALLHAIADALLGAAGLGDIGDLFPDSDASIAGIPSSKILLEVMQQVRDAGFMIGNVDAIVSLQRPRLGPKKGEMRLRVADLLGLSTASRVSIKAKTGEGLGAVGRGEAVAAQAIASLVAVSDRPATNAREDYPN